MKGSRKEQIRQAAITVIAQEGFHGATTDKIAAQARVAVGTIYNYFKNKEDILAHIFAVEYEKRLHFFTRLEEEDIHPLDKIKGILTMHFAGVRENPNLVRVILEEKNFFHRYYERGPDCDQCLQGFLEQVINRGVREGKLRPCDPEMVAVVLFGFIEAIMGRYLCISNGGDDNDFLEAAVNEIIALLAEGLVSA